MNAQNKIDDLHFAIIDYKKGVRVVQNKRLAMYFSRFIVEWAEELRIDQIKTQFEDFLREEIDNVEELLHLEQEERTELTEGDKEYMRHNQDYFNNLGV